MSEAPPNELDDELAAALGRHVREREQALLDARAPEWEAVARGQLSAELGVERRRAAGDEHPELAAECFRPFDANETSALVGALVGGLLAGPEADAPGEVENVIPIAKPAPAPAPEPTPGTSEQDPGVSWWIPGGLLLAAAAAILLWWGWSPGPDMRGIGDDGPKLAQLDPLPSYVLETDGGLEQLRGDTDGPDTGPDHYRLHTAFEWILRPELDASGEVGVRGFAFVDAGAAGLSMALDELVVVAATGAIRITGTIGQLDLEPGRYTIALAVGRPDALPTQASDLVAPTSEDTWAVRRVDIIIED